MERPDDLHELETALLDGIGQLTASPVPAVGCDLSAIFLAQVRSRVLDHTARWLRAQGHGYYTIGSAGHESNAAIAAALRPTDPALLHYRSGGFYCARAAQVDGSDPIRDVLSGMLALVDEPIAGGRHKVFGRHDLAIIPQTSTIGSQVPRSLGVAFAIGRARQLEVASPWPDDALAVSSFGDASANHSTVQGAVNAACALAHQGVPVPLLLVCEDNGLGISTPTPTGWIESVFAHRPELTYVAVEGTDPAQVYGATAELADQIRSTGTPGLIHLRTVRYLGHAGSDLEAAYRRADEIRADYRHDPLLATARTMVDTGLAGPGDLVDLYLETTATTRQLALDLVGDATLTTPAAVIAPLAPRRADAVAQRVASQVGEDRTRAFGATLPEDAGPLTLAETINRTLHDIFAASPTTLAFGEDVAVKGGVYGLTRGLRKQFGPDRVFDSILDEQTILGLALGAAVSGFVPIPEIQYLAYLHNAEDQLRGEAASLSFFSNGQYVNPMVVRIASYAYQKGFGGHFHNDHSVAVLRDIPGLVIASPSHPADAAAMLRTCVAAAETDGTVSAYLEPIALYHTRDLHEPGDGLWTADYEPPERWGETHIPIGSGRLVRDGVDVLIVSWANGVFLSLQAARQLSAEGISVGVFDMRWLNPLPIDQIIEHAERFGRVLIVDETRRTGGVAEGVIAELIDAGYRGDLARVAAVDTFIPLGDAANVVLVQPDMIVDAVRRMN
ncbi:MAG: MFS transporter [Ilumatobacter coccineus]|uniref:MFS transporter n=1 Tax=Ilumatobacter coccineus TaxID=467094 RepID=A0A2G6KBW4_9ACTN|nr:MAG: MFS transporter [Ilumatobacter coccineus]